MLRGLGWHNGPRPEMEAPVNQSQRIVVGIAVFVAAMVAWASLTGFNWWSPAGAFFMPHHYWGGYAPFLVLFIIFAMKRNCRWRDGQDRPNRPDRPDRPDRPRR